MAAAISRSLSAKTMLALLPPSSRVIRLTWSAAPRMIRCPTAVEPVKQTLRTAGWVTNRSPTTEPLPGDDGEDALGEPGLEGELAEPHRGQRGQLGGLEHDGVAGRQGRGEAPAGDRHREVPRHDDPDDAERLLERDVEAAGDRDLPAEQPLRRGRVVGQHVADVAGLPAGVADRVAGVGHLELGQLLEVVVDDLGEPAQQPATVGRGHGAPGRSGGLGRGDRGVGLLERRPASTVVTDRLGGRVDAPRATVALTAARTPGPAPSR